MHHCLYISEVISLIFEFVRHWDDKLYQTPPVGKKTLASLARTCHLFSSLALDALWHDLYNFDPLLKVFPTATSSVDDPHWPTFYKYAKRVKTFHGRDIRVPVQVRQEIITTLQRCPGEYLPLFSNVVELEWSELSFSAPEDSGVLLLRNLAGPAVTTVTLSLMGLLAYSSAELSLMADLPRLCPNVTSFTFVLHLSWVYDPSSEIGKMVTQWPKLRTLRTCAVAQPVMDQLFARRTLESLHIDSDKSSPVYSGTIPGTLREFTLGADCPASCTRFLETAYASPIKVHLLIGMNDRQEEADIEETFYLLPRRLDTSCLLSLTVQPKSSIAGIPMWHTPRLREPLLSALVEFRALHDLDLDLFCTAQISDTDYEYLALSLTHLRTLKLGTADSSITRPRPVASIGAMVAVLRHCQLLETLHILFDGSIPPPRDLTAQDGKEALAEELTCGGWGVCNRRITKLRVGYSPIVDATINATASCLKSIVPCLVQIEREARDEEWRLVQNILNA